jgi:hypothetical protein
MIDTLLSSGVPEPWPAQLKETSALNFGLSSKELLSHLRIDEFSIINDSPIQSSGICNSSFDIATRQNHHRLPRQQRRSPSQKHIMDKDKRLIPSTKTDPNMTSMHVTMCHRHGKKENFTHQGTSTIPTSFQTQTTSNVYHSTATPMKATHSSSGPSVSDQFAFVQFQPPKTSLSSTKVDGSYELFQSMAGMELNWPSKTPSSFGSVTESSPSLSSSFEFMDLPREDRVPCGLPRPESTFMGHLPEKDFATSDAPFNADHLSGSSNIDTSFQYPMGTETETWPPQYYPDRQAWPTFTTLPSCSWPMPDDLGASSPKTQLMAPYHFSSNNVLPWHNDLDDIPAAPRPDEPDYSSVTPLDMGTSQPQPTNILQSHTGLPAMLDCTVSYPTLDLSAPHPNPPQHQNKNLAIEASLHYSDARNALLIEWKRAGLSYKDIKRMGGFKEAESTLRGRFRTLTKAKEHRVRKPKWLKSDVSLTQAEDSPIV